MGAKFIFSFKIFKWYGNTYSIYTNWVFLKKFEGAKSPFNPNMALLLVSTTYSLKYHYWNRSTSVKDYVKRYEKSYHQITLILIIQSSAELKHNPYGSR